MNLKDLERDIRLCEKEIDGLADQISQREMTLRLDVERLRQGVEALRRYLVQRDPSFDETYWALKRSVAREVEGSAPEGSARE